MTIKEIKQNLSSLGNKNIDLSKILLNIKILKKNAVKRNLEERAKELWIFETITLINLKYQKAIHLLKSREFFIAWCLLEEIEIKLKSLNRHFIYNDNYKLSFIERTIKNIQVLYPYRMFSSSELLKKKKECNICGKVVSLRNPCGHIVGEIYNGEQCTRIVTEAEVLGIAVVENPVNKYGVLFSTGKDKEGNSVTADHYNYELLETFLKLDLSPYDYWNLELTETFFPHPEKLAGNSCPCFSGKEYLDCCANKPGIKGFHYEFFMRDHHVKKVFRKNPLLKNELKTLNKNSKGPGFI